MSHQFIVWNKNRWKLLIFQGNKYVPIEKFESVCIELNNALGREEQAQNLLQEQAKQLEELSARMDIFSSEGMEKEQTLSEAIQVIAHSEVFISFLSALCLFWKLSRKLVHTRRGCNFASDPQHVLPFVMVTIIRFQSWVTNILTTKDHSLKWTENCITMMVSRSHAYWCSQIMNNSLNKYSIFT